jgi:hypothetical protein
MEVVECLIKFVHNSFYNFELLRKFRPRFLTASYASIIELNLKMLLLHPLIHKNKLT